MANAFRLPALPTIKEIVRLYKLRALKHLSQNFLLDPKLINKIVKVAGNIEGGYVCEVGPGPGGITRAILQRGVKQLTVIEKDRRFLPGLDMLNDACDNRIVVHQGDVLNFDMSDMFPKHASVNWHDKPPNLHLIGNLPFSVSTPLLVKWLKQISEKSGPWELGRVGMTLTFQKEVGERIVADIGSPQRSRLSIMCQYLCHVKLKFLISGRSFLPKPDVDVAVLHFIPKITPESEVPYDYIDKVVRHVFHYRQKMCKRGIHTLFPPDRADLVERMVINAEIEGSTRPYHLDISEYDRLSIEYKNICHENPGIFEYDYRSQKNAQVWRESGAVAKIGYIT